MAERYARGRSGEAGILRTTPAGASRRPDAERTLTLDPARLMFSRRARYRPGEGGWS